MNLETLKKTVSNNPDGVTMNLNGEAVSLSGFAVSITHETLKAVDVEQGTEAFKRTLERLLSTATALNRPAFIGAWKDNDILCLDVTLNIQDRNDALTVARLFKQLAIFDFNNLTEVRV
jgi:hypothetical protein